MSQIQCPYGCRYHIANAEVGVSLSQYIIYYWMLQQISAQQDKSSGKATLINVSMKQKLTKKIVQDNEQYKLGKKDKSNSRCRNSNVAPLAMTSTSCSSVTALIHESSRIKQRHSILILLVTEHRCLAQNQFSVQ